MLSYLTDYSEYMPHGMCLLWEPWLLLLWGGSDILILGAYFAIPIALLLVVRRRRDFRHRGIITLFASFIFMCGITHGLSVVTLWLPIYPLQGAVKLATGLVSALTAVVLFRLVPTLVSVPSMKDMEQANNRLRAEVLAHEKTLADLRSVRDRLEQEVAERTAELRDANDKMALTAREAIHRGRNLLSVVASMARQSARGQTDVAEFVETLIGRLRALADATSAFMEKREKTSADLKDVIARQLDPVTQTYQDKVHLDVCPLEVSPEAAQRICLAVHELATNAQKYGSLAQEQGRLWVTCREELGDDGQRMLTLNWREKLPQGADSVQDQANKGFGTRLLNEIIPGMLGGTSTKRLENGYLVYELVVPSTVLLPDTARTESEAFVVSFLDEAPPNKAG